MASNLSFDFKFHVGNFLRVYTVVRFRELLEKNPNRQIQTSDFLDFSKTTQEEGIFGALLSFITNV